MSLILACVDTLIFPIKIENYFLEILKVNDTLSKGLFNEIINVIKKYELDDKGEQNYDNGCNMEVFRCIYLLFASSIKQWKNLQDNVSKFFIISNSMKNSNLKCQSLGCQPPQ
ncbi:hypothetical protein CR513_48008, partial [Mucuna pruriens]